MDATFPVQYGTYNWTSGFGPRVDPLGRGSGFHWGVDIAPKQPGLKVPLYSPVDGVVTVPAFEAGGAGNNIWITDDDGVLWKLFHMDSISVRSGQRVKAGERVGTMGTTGASSGVHVHVERWKNGQRTDPTQYLRAAEAAGRFPGAVAPAPPPAPPITEDADMLAVNFNGHIYSYQADRGGHFWLHETDTVEVVKSGQHVVAIPAPGTEPIDRMWEKYPHVGGPFAS